MLGHAVCPCFPSFPMPVLPGPGALFGTGEYSDRLLHIMQVRSLLSGITTKRVPSGSVSSLISRSESTAARLMATSTSLAPQSAACWWRRRRFRPSAQPRLFPPPPPPCSSFLFLSSNHWDLDNLPHTSSPVCPRMSRQPLCPRSGRRHCL